MVLIIFRSGPTLLTLLRSVVVVDQVELTEVTLVRVVAQEDGALGRFKRVLHFRLVEFGLSESQSVVAVELAQLTLARLVVPEVQLMHLFQVWVIMSPVVGLVVRAQRVVQTTSLEVVLAQEH